MGVSSPAKSGPDRLTLVQKCFILTNLLKLLPGSFSLIENLFESSFVDTKRFEKQHHNYRIFVKRFQANFR